MFEHQIQLIGLVEGVNENGFPDLVETTKEPILAKKLSVRSNDFWSAKQSGVNLVYAFEVHSFEYDGEEKLQYENERYDVERTYNKGDTTEIYCSRKSDDHAI